jgi:carbon monoxide dehydrogenase subunit G
MPRRGLPNLSVQNMASIRKEVLIDAHPDEVWTAVRDVGAVHQRLAEGFVVDTRLDGDARVVTFANGLVVRELIVDVDDADRRLAYAAVGGRATHHNASIQVFADGRGGTRLMWITDVLPNEVAGPIGALVEQGARAMKQTLERAR